MTNEQIARVCHEVNRAYCQALGDYSQVPWDEAPEWQQRSALTNVRLHREHPEAGPEISHRLWCQEKTIEGWIYGTLKNAEAKTHPCLVPFDKLPLAQQAKDYIFRAVVLALSDE
jgi:hypothetical protein